MINDKAFKGVKKGKIAVFISYIDDEFVNDHYSKIRFLNSRGQWSWDTIFHDSDNFRVAYSSTGMSYIAPCWNSSHRFVCSTIHNKNSLVKLKYYCKNYHHKLVFLGYMGE